MYQQTRRELYEVLTNRFNLGELRTLAFDLNIEFEDLEGDTKSSKAVALIDYANRRGRLEDLLRYLMKLRPDVKWTQLDAPSESSINFNIGNVGPGGAIGKGASVRAENIAGRDITIYEQFLEQKDEFKKKLANLQNHVEQILSHEQYLSKEGLIILENLQDIIDQTSTSSPNTRWIILRLEDTRRVLQEMIYVSGIDQVSIRKLKDSIEIVGNLIKLSESAFANAG